MTDTAAPETTTDVQPEPAPGVWTPERDRRLRAPFDPDQIEKLPKQLRREDQDKGKCEPGSRYTADGHTCGGYHARSVHLDYVGHAGITMRLNEVDPTWDWQPVPNPAERGLPVRNGELWIQLTVLGITKYGLGDDAKSNKELYGDAIRNAAMRFGVATYLWSKSGAAQVLKAGGDVDDVTPVRAAATDAAPAGPAKWMVSAANDLVQGIIGWKPADKDTEPRVMIGDRPALMKVLEVAQKRGLDTVEVDWPDREGTIQGKGTLRDYIVTFAGSNEAVAAFRAAQAAAEAAPTEASDEAVPPAGCPARRAADGAECLKFIPDGRKSHDGKHEYPPLAASTDGAVS